MAGQPADGADRDVLITRRFRAPRALVFAAWTDAERLKRWYAPQGCTTPFCRIDPRPGGLLHLCISSPTHGDCWCRGVYREVVAPERLVYTLGFADAEGNPAATSKAGGDPEWPAETVVTVTFAEQDGGTLVTLHQTVRESVARRTGAYPSWLSMLDRLAEDLSQPAAGGGR